MDAIVAISTPVGTGGIGIIRMSGKDTFKVLKKIFISKNNYNLNDIKGYSMKYGFIINTVTKEKIDEVLVSFFKNPKSYTREDMCEINSHGGIIVERLILQECLNNGAVLAEPGEFTKRAFLNGRIDLTQAESIIDIINSKTENESKVAIKQLNGGLYQKIKEIKDLILDISSNIEASIDYPEYEIEDVTNNIILNRLEIIKEKLFLLKETFNNGKIIKNGIKCVIVGKPNVGKSSLMNAILEEERAIVSEIEGTTRDTIEEYINIKGICLKLIDTAGIRDTDNVIEKIGVKKALDYCEEADLIIAMLDASRKIDNEDLQIMEKIKDKKHILLLNKVDIISREFKIDESLYNNLIRISVYNNEGLDILYNKIEEMFNINEIEINDGCILTNIRHQTEINNCINSIENAILEIRKKMEIDIVSIFIRESLECLNNITGENVSEDILNKIFSKFCLGK